MGNLYGHRISENDDHREENDSWLWYGMHCFCSTHTPSKRFILLTTYEEDFEPSTNSSVINLIAFLTKLQNTSICLKYVVQLGIEIDYWDKKAILCPTFMPSTEKRLSKQKGLASHDGGLPLGSSLLHTLYHKLNLSLSKSFILQRFDVWSLYI